MLQVVVIAFLQEARNVIMEVKSDVHLHVPKIKDINVLQLLVKSHYVVQFVEMDI